MDYLIPGYEVMMAGRKHSIPPLNIRGVQKHEKDIQSVQDKKSKLTELEKMDVICNVILTAMQRNYPSMTLEFIKEWLDMRNIQPTFHAVMGHSGYVEVKDELGETERAGSTGTNSTPASLPEPAALGNT